MKHHIMKYLRWITKNKEWLFSGIGVLAITTIIGLFGAFFSKEDVRSDIEPKNLKAQFVAYELGYIQLFLHTKGRRKMGASLYESLTNEIGFKNSLISEDEIPATELFSYIYSKYGSDTADYLSLSNNGIKIGAHLGAGDKPEIKEFSELVERIDIPESQKDEFEKLWSTISPGEAGSKKMLSWLNRVRKYLKKRIQE